MADAPPSFDFQPLGRVIFEAGALARLGEVVRELGGRRVLLVTDPGLAHARHPQRAGAPSRGAGLAHAGPPQRAEASIRGAGLDVFTFDGVKENPTEREVAAGVVFAKSHAIDAIVAVGGGSSMDCAKGINFLLTNGGRMADYKGFGKAAKPMLPSVGVPTTSGTGSEAQCYALITDEKTHLKMACGDKKAAFRVSILDPEVTLSQPRTVSAVTGIDAVAHAIESFVCTKRNPFSQMCSLNAWKHLEPNFERVMSHPADLAARSAMLLGSHFAGMAIESAMLGVCHSCANPLTAHYGITHGVAIGVMLPHVIRFNAGEAAAAALYSQLAGSVDALADRVARMLAASGLPASLKECGVSESILHLLAEEANEQWTARFNPRPVGESEILDLYRSAW